jgi:hypothetical protein
VVHASSVRRWFVGAPVPEDEDEEAEDVEDEDDADDVEDDLDVDDVDVDDVDEDDVDEDDVEDEDDEACVASECPASAEVDPLPLLLHAATQKAMKTQGTVWRVSISRYYVRCVGSSNERGVRKGTPWHRGRGPHVEARAGTRARVGEPSATVSSVSKQRARARRRVRHRGVLRL